MSPEEIARMMQEIVGLDEVGVEDSFFEIGGNSFLALELLGRIQQRTGVMLGMLEMVQTPTATGVSERLAGHGVEVGAARGE
jgi:acyl carrier protein